MLAFRWLLHAKAWPAVADVVWAGSWCEENAQVCGLNNNSKPSRQHASRSASAHSLIWFQFQLVAMWLKISLDF